MSIDPTGNVWRDQALRLPRGVPERHRQLRGALDRAIAEQGPESDAAKGLTEYVKKFERAFPGIESTFPEEELEPGQPGQDEGEELADDAKQGDAKPQPGGEGQDDSAQDPDGQPEQDDADVDGQPEDGQKPDDGQAQKGKPGPGDKPAKGRPEAEAQESDEQDIKEDGEEVGDNDGDSDADERDVDPNASMAGNDPNQPLEQEASDVAERWGEREQGWDVRDARELAPVNGIIDYVPTCEAVRPYNPTNWMRGHLIPMANGERRPLWHSVIDVSDLEKCLDFQEGHVRRDVNRKWWKEHMREGSMGSMKSWYGGLVSWGGARRLLREGWTDGAQKADELSLELEKELRPLETVRRRPVRGDDGNDLDIDRAMRGQTDTMWWRTARSRKTTSRLVRLVATFGGNASRDSAALIWSAAAMIATCRALEKAGYSVAMSGVIPTEHAHGVEASYSLAEVEIKKFGQALRVGMAAAVFGHAGVFRTAGFGYMHANPWNVDTGLGRETSAVPLIARAVEHKTMDPVTVIFDHVFSKQEALNEFKTALERITGEKDLEVNQGRSGR